MKAMTRILSVCVLLGFVLLGWMRLDFGNSGSAKKICFIYQDLETEFWVASHTLIVKELKERGFQVIEYSTRDDVNAQFQSIKDCINQRADGIMLIPWDGDSAITIVNAANAANIPIGVFNRPPSDNNPNPALVVVANNEMIAQQTVQFMAEQAMRLHRKVHPLLLVGDLGDPNSTGRKEGFDTVIARYPDRFRKPIYINTRWEAATTQHSLQEAMQNDPYIDFIFTSSDFLYPQIKAVLEPLGKWKPRGDPNHVILGGLDGDSRACSLMKSGYVDATGVQDLFFEAKALTNALIRAINGKQARPNRIIQDSGFTVTQDNLHGRANAMWGCALSLPVSGV